MKEIPTLSAKAQTFLGTAEQALRIGDFDSCASRGYYAMFFMAEAALLTKELTSSSHKGVHNLFGEHFAKTGILEKYLGRALNDAYDMRLVGDYAMGHTVTKEEAESLLETARDFVRKVQDYLDKWAQQK